MPEHFAQFHVTPVDLDLAVRLVGGDSRPLRALAKGETTEWLLPTYAKLVAVGDGFGVFSYSHDGSDGREACAQALA